MGRQFAILFVGILCLGSCKKDNNNPGGEDTYLQLISVSVGPNTLAFTEPNTGMPVGQAIVFRFSQAVDRNAAEANIQLLDNQDNPIGLAFAYLDNDRTVSALPVPELSKNSTYKIHIGEGMKGSKDEKFTGLNLEFKTLNPPLTILEVKIGDQAVQPYVRITGVAFNPVIRVSFSEDVQATVVSPYASLKLNSLGYNFTTTQTGDSILTFTVTDNLPYYRKFNFTLSENLATEIQKPFAGYSFEFYTRLDETPKFPLLTDEELLTRVQEQTFKYFWDFGHPISGLSRERNSSGQTVTSGGSGFGVMAIIVGIERGFITRAEGIERLNKIVDFLATADRFHGAWAHWMNGTTGDVIPFSTYDNGGDLVETSYMAMGLITARQYLNSNDPGENTLIGKINALWEGIEWDWYTQGQNSLTWHWSPNYGFQMNMTIRGWNECLITYIMAASSPTHSISKQAYIDGWGGGPNMLNGNTYYGITLPFGRSYGGPLFFEQYTFLGLDPRNLSDVFGNYWEQVVNHTLINREHCIVNPYHYVGYNEECWGLTASDGDQGYSAHSPTNDRGVISPTAALSSIPFTPTESMEALHHFYYDLGDRLWGPYGFYDAFNVTNGWFGTTNIAIDQGPIIGMIENYRSQLLWNLFMSAPEVQAGLTKLGFTY